MNDVNISDLTTNCSLYDDIYCRIMIFLICVNTHTHIIMDSLEKEVSGEKACVYFRTSVRAKKI